MILILSFKGICSNPLSSGGPCRASPGAPLCGRPCFRQRDYKLSRERGRSELWAESVSVTSARGGGACSSLLRSAAHEALTDDGLAPQQLMSSARPQDRGARVFFSFSEVRLCTCAEAGSVFRDLLSESFRMKPEPVFMVPGPLQSSLWFRNRVCPSGLINILLWDVIDFSCWSRFGLNQRLVLKPVLT